MSKPTLVLRPAFVGYYKTRAECARDWKAGLVFQANGSRGYFSNYHEDIISKTYDVMFNVNGCYFTLDEVMLCET